MYITFRIEYFICAEYVESIISRAPACSMYPPSKTPLLFQGYHLRRQQQEQQAAETGGKDRYPSLTSSIGESYDHMTGTSAGGASSLKRSTSSTSASAGDRGGGGGFKSKMVPIRRPAILNSKYVIVFLLLYIKELFCITALDVFRH